MLGIIEGKYLKKYQYRYTERKLTLEEIKRC